MYTTNLDFNISFAIYDFNVEPEEQLLEMRTELLCLPRSEMLICIAVLPDQRTSLVFYEAALCSLHKLLHDLEGVRLPCAIRVLGHTVPLVTCGMWQLVVEAAFGSQPDFRDAAKPLLEHLPVSAAQDDHCVSAVCTERSKTPQYVFIWGRAMALEVRDIALGCTVLAVQVPLVGCQCSLIIQEENAVLCIAIPPHHFVLFQLSEVFVDHYLPQLCPEADVLDSHTFLLLCPSQVCQEILEPSHGRVLRCVKKVGLNPLLLLVSSHRQCPLAGADNLACVPGVDSQRAQQNPAASRKFAHDDHTCWLRIVVVSSDKLKRHQVQASLHGRVEQHIGCTEQGKAFETVHLFDAEVDVMVIIWAFFGISFAHHLNPVLHVAL
mmetsp:Transcript_2144/g.5990  ORF Transcript_2144/g.5990 Transcript_2144/m.5990 type:complete len:379 (+) Transcript_2144:728-1864(+)